MQKVLKQIKLGQDILKKIAELKIVNGSISEQNNLNDKLPEQKMHKQKMHRQRMFRPRIYYVIFGILIMMCLGTVYSYSIFRLPIEELYGIGTAKSGFPYMFSLLFYALFMFITGRFVDKYSPGIIILTGGFFVAVGWILAGFAGNIYVLTLFYGVFIGSGVGIAYGVPMNVAAKWFPDKKGLIVGMVLIGFGASPFITAPFAKFLIDQFGVMRTFQILGMIFGIIIAFLACFFRYPSDSENVRLISSVHEEVNPKDMNTGSMVRTLSFKKLYITFIVGTMIGLMIVGMTSNVGIEIIKLSPAKTAALMSVFAIFNGIGRPVFGWFADKVSYKKAMMLSYILILIAAILMLFAKEGSMILYITAFSLFWLNLGGWLAIAPATTMSLYGTKHYSRNYGVVFTAYGVGAIAGVLTSGLLKDIYKSYHQIFYLILFLSVIGIIAARDME